jgi:hypothetical protein
MKKTPQETEPRLLTINQVAAYWAVSPNTFRKIVRKGIAPGPLEIPGLGRLVFDRTQQDRAIDGLRSERAA